MTRQTGAELLVRTLEAMGATQAYGVPGESYLSVLDALYDSPINYTICRQEGGAAMAAEAHGKMTGEPGICMVTRGPGATNASAGVHVAYQDSTPMILFIGQVGREMIEREAFQEIDYRRMFGQMAKWVAQIDDAARIPEFVSRAFHTATNGRPGPVVLALPEDMLRDEVDNAVIPQGYKRSTPAASTEELAELKARLASAERPLMIVGGGGWSAKTARHIEHFAEANQLPVATSFRCQDYFNNDHPNYAGHVGIGIDPQLAQHIRNSDLLILFGTRLGEMTSNGYSLVDIPCPAQSVVHIHSSAEELGRVYAVELAINASSAAMAKQLAELGTLCQRVAPDWAESCRAAYDAFTQAPQIETPMKMKAVVEHLRDVLPDNSFITNGAGNYAIWVHRFFKYRDYRSQLAPTSGSMGYGLPAAVAAATQYPDREVICFAGDGCFMMTCQELATAAQSNLNMVVIVVNNGMYGTIRMHQERRYPARVSGTDLFNPDFVALAQSYGCHAECVTQTEEFPAALERARAFKGTALLEIQVDPEALTPMATLTEIRNA